MKKLKLYVERFFDIVLFDRIIWYEEWQELKLRMKKVEPEIALRLLDEFQEEEKWWKTYKKEEFKKKLKNL